MLKISVLKIENLINPIGIDEKNPIFTWKLESDDKIVFQEAFHLIVKNKGTIVYDSSLVKSDIQRDVYKGKPLLSFEKYDVSLYVKDNHGCEARINAFFEMGFMDDYKVQAKLIAKESDKDEDCALFTKEFSIKKEVVSARCYATSLGMYHLMINGNNASDILYTPYWTSYNHRLEYQTYDIKDLLKDNNKIEVLLSEGWYKGELAWEKHRCIFGDRLALLMEIHIYYKDGSKDIITTDESWKYKDSYIRYTSIYHGETQDFTFKDDNERNAIILDKKLPKLVAQISEPVRNIDTLYPLSIKEYDNHRFIVDFGQNLTGVVELTLKGKRGQKITLRHSEVLNGDELYIENLRNAKATDNYILDGNKRTLSPIFTWHGFRYAEITGLDSLDDVSIKAYSRHNSMERTGYFKCSNELVNKLYLNQLWSNKDNYLDIPTDCNQRDERLGWTADVSDYAETAAKNYDVHLTLFKWLGDLSLDQSLEYGVPYVIPDVLSKKDSASSAWADAATIVPWTLYNVYGDLRIIERQYDSMKLWVKYIINHLNEKGLWMEGFHFGDWLALDKDAFSDRTGATDIYYISNIYFLISLRILKNSAKLLNKDKDYEECIILEKKLLKAIRDEYLTKNGRLVSDTQTGILLALHLNIFRNKEEEKYAALRLKENIIKYGHIMTGFLGTPLLLNILSKYGLNDLCELLLLREEFPGWLYEVKKGATTMWERWDSMSEDGHFHSHDMNSFNHCAYGAVAEWMYRSLGGIDYLEPGYKKILIKPVRIKTIDKVECSIESIYGRISTKIDYNKKKMEVVIPVGTSAIVSLENKRNITLFSGKHIVKLN